jgi:hypothetical protein
MNCVTNSGCFPKKDEDEERTPSKNDLGNLNSCPLATMETSSTPCSMARALVVL